MKTVAIAGPTGTGKSELAVRLAEAAAGEVVNYDSVQIYRGFDVGSAKPDAATRARVPHHLFDIVDADEDFNAAAYARLAGSACQEIRSRGNRPVLVGGTFFYLRALLAGLPEMPGRNEAIRARIRAIAARPGGPARLHAWLTRVDAAAGDRIAPGDRHRVERALEVWITSGRPISGWMAPGADGAVAERGTIRIALTLERARLVERLDRRVEEMYANGLVEETASLLARFPKESRPFGAIGYREAVAVVEGRMTRAEAVEETRRRTRSYAKRQMTWLRSERDVHWIDASDPERTFTEAMRLIEV